MIDQSVKFVQAPEKEKYLSITVKGGGSYIVPWNTRAGALEGETDMAVGEEATLVLKAVEMTHQEFSDLPEFVGH